MSAKIIEWVPGMIAQVNPETETFGGCMVVVTEAYEWGVMGYVQSAGVQGQQWIRLAFDTVDIVPTGGYAVWVVA